LDVGGEPSGMFAVRNTAHLPIVLGAAVAGMNYDGGTGERPECFQALQQTRVEFKLPAASAGKFTS
jgi:hypothetical protein